jgi:apolipoprotein N-acyltransferase
MRNILGSIKNGIDSFCHGRKRRVILVLLSAILMPLAMPNDLLRFGNPIIGLFCMIPFFIALSEPETYRFSVILGIIFGTVSTFIMYYWLQFFGEYSVWTLGGVIFVYVLFCVILVPAISGLLRVFPRYKPIVFTCAWVFYEFLKSSGFLAFPWGLLAHPFHGILPFIQFADITGVWGVSFLVALVNATLGNWIASERFQVLPGADSKEARLFLLRRETIFAGILVCIAFAYGGFRMLYPIPVETTFKAVLVQPNADPWARNAYEKSILNCIELSEKGSAALGEKPDLVIWNETSFEHPFPMNESALEKFPKTKPFLPFLRGTGTYFLVGAPYVVDTTNYNVMNAALLLSPEGKILCVYGKMQPVPFVESNPFWNLKFLQPLFRAIDISGSGWQMGSDFTILSVPLRKGTNLKFATPICFEDAFPDLCRRFILKGASTLINLTNVSWSKTESAEIQMFVAAKFRAIETKRTFVRSTNSGVTSVIGPRGEVLASVPLFKEEYLAMDIPVYKEKTLTAYTECGDYFPFFTALVVFFVLGFNLLVVLGEVKKRM